MVEREVGTSTSIFDIWFGRRGEILRVADIPVRPEEYMIVSLDRKGLLLADQLVRDVEGDFARVYDKVQFTTPGMRHVAEVDTAVLERWIGNVSGKRVLEIGPGTGRVTLPIADAVGPDGTVFAVETAVQYLYRLMDKASWAGVDPRSLILGVADIQQVDFEALQEFVGARGVDAVIIWFGPLSLMTTDPEGVISKCSRLLNSGGSLLITSNSLNGLCYRVQENAMAQGADPNLPLGYSPSIFTRRRFVENDYSKDPNGMVLGTGEVLPARFYDPSQLVDMLGRAGLIVTETYGICRLTGLFPASMDDNDGVKRFMEIASAIEPEFLERMRGVEHDAEVVWELAVDLDKKYANDPAKLGEYVYPAYKAVRPDSFG